VAITVKNTNVMYDPELGLIMAQLFRCSNVCGVHREDREHFSFSTKHADALVLFDQGKFPRRHEERGWYRVFARVDDVALVVEILTAVVAADRIENA